MRQNRIRGLAAILFMLLAYPAISQVDFEFSGYVVELPMYQRLPSQLATFGNLEQDMAVSLTRLRLRPTLRLWEGASFALEHEADLLYSSQDLLFGATSDMTNRQAVDLRWHPMEGEVSLQHYVDRLYFRQNLTWGSIVAGRQRIQWGTGRIWNPTDLFNPINPASFDKIEKDGADAVSVKAYLGSFTDMQAVVNFRKARGQADGASPPDSTNFGVRFRTNYLEFDVSAMGGWFDRRVIFGGDFAGNLFEAGVRGEAAYVTEGEDMPNSDYLRMVLGADYQFTPEFYALIEYLYNGEGHAEQATYELGRLYQGDILNLNRKYVYLGGTYLVHPLVTASAGLMQSIGDGSGFLSLIAAWSSSDNSVVSAGLLLPYGNSGDEYFYYPTSVYAKGEFYF
ncbi:MAG: hypothetical protein IH600_08750 [Bacteroidetes bacterium]|nr:hypothetical protein [Bacteroidota bacterium]